MRSPAGDQTDLLKAGCAADTTAPCRLRIKAGFALLRLCEGSHERKNWLFAGSMKAAERAAAIMSLIESAKLNGLEPQAYLTDVLRRLPTQLNSRIHELLPTHWKPQGCRRLSVSA
jgi:hypothetical protein